MEDLERSKGIKVIYIQKVVFEEEIYAPSFLVWVIYILGSASIFSDDMIRIFYLTNVIVMIFLCLSIPCSSLVIVR